MTQAVILQKLKDSGAKLTAARKAVVQVLVRGSASPRSAEDIFKAIRKDTACDLVSVYRTLALLEELAVVRRSDLFQEAAHFELVSGDHHRHLIICKSCQRIDPIDICLVKAQSEALKRLGYKDVSHRLEFSGLCPACA